MKNDLSTRQEVRQVLLLTLGLNLVVALGKIIIGLMSGLLAITADGFHSLVDGSSNIVALAGNWMAARPPDEDHPYGHRRFETLAALLIGIFLILTAWEIGKGALGRLQSGQAELDLTPLTFIVLVMTLLVNIGVSTYEHRAGKRLNSELLLADATHTRTDIFITISVLISTALVALTDQTWIDTLAAIIVIGLILRAAYDILRDTGSVLVDKAPYSPERLTGLVATIPGVRGVLRARSRGREGSAHIDLDVLVDSYMTTAQTESITAAIRARLQRKLTDVDEIEVHFVPEEPDKKDYALIVRAVADQHGLSTHEVNLVQSAEGARVLDLHVEVPAEQELSSAHQQVSRLEDSLSAQLPDVDEIITHIEPLANGSLGEDLPLTEINCAKLKRRALALLKEKYPEIDWHNLHVYGELPNLGLSLHAGLRESLSVDEAHRLAEDAELLLRAHMTSINRVTIHTEPCENA